MSKADALTFGRDGKRRHRVVFGIVHQLREFIPSLYLVTGLMVATGILSGLAEMVGITLLISLIFLIAQDAPTVDQPLAWLPRIISDFDVSLPKGVVIGILAGAIVLRLLLGLANGLIGSFVAHHISERIRGKLYDKILDLAFQDIGRHDRGELITILSTESYTVAGAHASLVRLGVNIGTIVIFGIGMLGIAWPIALVGLAFGVVHNATMRLFATSYRRLGKALSGSLEDLTQLSWTTLLTLKAVRSFGLEDKQRSLFANLSHEVARKLRRSEQLGAITSILSEALIFGVLLGIMLFSSFLAVDFPAALSATVLLYRLQPHINELDQQILHLHEMETPLQRVFTLLAQPGERHLNTRGFPSRGVERAIEFKNVTFRYPDTPRPAIESISFFIKSGEKTALVGPSGAGKTTIMNLILRLAEPTSGSIVVDGTSLQNIQRSSWLQQLAIAGQDVELMEGTVRENILFYRDFPDEDVRWAAELAGAAEFIDELSYGYEEWLGDEAVKLSVGQRQRIGLARALVGRKNTLFLDEATNALDEETEMRVLTRILDEYKEKTVVVISHRQKVAALMTNRINLGGHPG
ncbi:ABC transporter ATP-binding protein/permease [Sinorhizobium numidicum]|uniref:ABC transporter ATP-binding protein/permease n=1 Tax=Sinorhizobium numidicum TaxID=680248 RepID=A0ABY8CW28_9HYPH|nr:ABC transporter ATP-binding protein [Sinorhizobium numidicum]WEX74945.1 ABC transporter ATP-binding protein/permease [Sinorhizobium numidicum]WEX80938.1 ABC transporter ATP-binding protein/permease [Sinorhizobium numidicum]